VNLTNLRDYSAVIFDLDGVLIDSMRYHVQAWLDVFKMYGVEIQPRDILLREGEKAGKTAQLLAQRHDLQWSQEDLENALKIKREIYLRQAPRGLRPVALEAVEACRRIGLKTAIVTGSVRSNLETVFAATDMALFDVIITAGDVKIGKPDPEPYLRAAELLKLPPNKCLVVENAPMGIRSARTAGMTCVAIETTLPKDDLQEAHFIIPDLDKLDQLKNLPPPQNP
jgi:beta-phosphoglucomutase